MRKNLFVFFFFCFLAIVLPGRAGLDLSTTELINIQGKVEVKKADNPFKPVPANLKLAGALKRLDSGDKVKTHNQSGAEMVLKDTCLLTVKEKSLFEVPAVFGQAALAQLKANQGSFLFKVVSGSDFKIQTADVIAGVKGTLFELEIVDDLRSVLSLPNLELGIEGGGGTNVNVYEGEVELKHTETGATRRLRAGEGLAAFGKRLRDIDKSLAEGFGPIRKFNPLQKIQQRFGAFGKALHDIKSTRLGFLGFDPAKFSPPVQLEKPFQRFSNLLEGMQDNLRQKLIMSQRLGGIIQQAGQELQKLQKTMENFKGEKFTPEFPEEKYPIIKSEVIVPENRVEEIHLGNGLFVSMAPDPGCSRLKIAPDVEGIRIEEGKGSFRIRDFAGEIDGVVTFRKEGDCLVSQIQMNKGNLIAKNPDQPSPIRISTNNPVAFAFSRDGNVQRIQPNPNNRVHPEIANRVFIAQHDFEAQKARHEQNEREKKAKALKGLIQDVNATKKFGSFLERPNLSVPKQQRGNEENLIGDWKTDPRQRNLREKENLRKKAIGDLKGKFQDLLKSSPWK